MKVRSALWLMATISLFLETDPVPARGCYKSVTWPRIRCYRGWRAFPVAVHN